MPSQEEVTTFTLSFSGVEFNLEPNCSSNNKDVLSIAKVCNNEIIVDFHNFSGVLRVTKGNNVMLARETVPTAEETSVQPLEMKKSEAQVPIPDAVPDEMPSPEPKEENSPKKKGQQTLDFFNRTKKETDTQVSKTSSKRTFEGKAQERRKKTRNTKSCIKEDNGSSAEAEEFQTTKFTMASLGQDMPSQESCVEKEIPIVMTNPQECNPSNDLFDDNFSFNMDDFSGDDLLFNNKLTPLKEDAMRSAETPTPCPRWGQSMTMIDHRRLVVYGGQTIDSATQMAMPLADLFVYDLMDHTWTKPINCEGVARTWHTANFLPEKQLLLCFGGDVVDDQGKTTTTDQVMVLDTDIMLWYPPSVSGQVPSGRSGHTASLLPSSNELVVFGGVKSGKWLNSVSVLETGRWKWSTPKILGDAPRPRSYHSATSLSSTDGGSSQIVIFGGNNDIKCFNCVHVLEQINGKMVWSHPKTSGKAPSPRTGHTATLLEDGYTIMIYGGWDPNTEDEKGDDLIFGDSFLLDTKTWTWNKGPKPKYAPFNVAASNGGLERVGHSSILAPGREGVQVLAFGGRLPDGFASDFQCLLPTPPQIQREASSRRK